MDTFGSGLEHRNAGCKDTEKTWKAKIVFQVLLIINVVKLFAFALGDGFDGGEGHFDASVGCDFENGLGSICADDGGVEASGGHDTVAGFKAFAVGGFIMMAVFQPLEMSSSSMFFLFFCEATERAIFD